MFLKGAENGFIKVAGFIMLKKIFTALIVFLPFALTSFAQTTERKKPELKDFGSSVKREHQENLEQKKRKDTEQDDDSIRVETTLD